MAEQEKKPTIQEEFNTNLSGDMLTNALAFVDHMDATEGWRHMDETVCFTVTDPGNFYIFVFGAQSSICNSELDSYPISDEMKQFVFDNINHCHHFRTNGEKCGCGQQPGHSYTILGKKYDNLCNCPICFMNPDAATFEKVKELVGAWKLCIEAVKLA